MNNLQLEILNELEPYINKNKDSVIGYIKTHPQMIEKLNTLFSDFYPTIPKLSEQVYCLKHNINSNPRDNIGKLLGYKNFEEGYTAYVPIFNKKSNKFVTSLNIDDKIMILRSNLRTAYFIKLISADIINYTNFLPKDTSIDERVCYIVLNITSPLNNCEYCNKTRSLRYEHTFERCCNWLYTQFNNIPETEYIDKILAYDKTDMKTFSILFSKLPDTSPIKIQVISEFHARLKKLTNPSNLNKWSFYQMFQQLKYNKAEIPYCKKCNKSLEFKFNTNLGLYPATCSIKCNNTYLNNIEKRLKNNNTNKCGYKLNTGKNEKIILDKLESDGIFNNIDRTSRVSKYFPDGICNVTNTIIEVNEAYHLSPKKMKYDIIKYKKYLELGYNIHIVWDNINIRKHQDKLDQIAELSYTNISQRYYNNSDTILDDLILTDSGWKAMSGVRAVQSDKDIYHIKTKSDMSVSVTSDHLLYLDNNKTKQANMLELGDIVSTINGPCEVISIEKETSQNKKMYDILDMQDEDSSFYANGFKVHNCLIIDEMAFIPKNIMDELWAAVYPVISSSLGTKAIGVSTANGIGNLFYELYSEGERNAISPNASAAGWKSIKFLWSDVPGRTEKWKEMQIASLKSMQRWQSEFGCEFLGAAYLLVQGADLVKMENHINLIDNKSIDVEELNGGQHKQYIRHQYQSGHAYIIGVDVADGIGNDFTVVKVFDITDPVHIIECAYLRENMLSTTDLPYILCKLGLRYGLAPILIESNFSTTVIKLLQEVYEYENIVCSKKNKLGIMATANSKVEACLNFKEIVENPTIVCDFFDMGLCSELKIFEKRPCGNKYGFTYGPKHDNDDTVIASVWAFYIFIEDILQYYFDVDFTYINGKKQPIKCKNFYREDDIHNAIKYFNEKIQHTHNVLKNIDTTDNITFESNSFDIYTAGYVPPDKFNNTKLPEW